MKELKEGIRFEIACKKAILFCVDLAIEEELELDDVDVDLLVAFIEMKIDLMDEIEKLKFLLTNI